MFQMFFRRPLLPLLALPLLLAPVPLPAQSGPGAYVVAETGRAFGRLQDAVDAIGDGEGTIRIAPAIMASAPSRPRGGSPLSRPSLAA
jgi:hypothetical protein